jgi:hypothetical protein
LQPANQRYKWGRSYTCRAVVIFVFTSWIDVNSKNSSSAILGLTPRCPLVLIRLQQIPSRSGSLLAFAIANTTRALRLSSIRGLRRFSLDLIDARTFAALHLYGSAPVPDLDGGPLVSLDTLEKVHPPPHGSHYFIVGSIHPLLPYKRREVPASSSLASNIPPKYEEDRHAW